MPTIFVYNRHRRHHHGRPHIAANGKKDEKLKSENMQKRAVFYVYVLF